MLKDILLFEDIVRSGLMLWWWPFERGPRVYSGGESANNDTSVEGEATTLHAAHGDSASLRKLVLEGNHAYWCQGTCKLLMVVSMRRVRVERVPQRVVQQPSLYSLCSAKHRVRVLYQHDTSSMRRLLFWNTSCGKMSVSPPKRARGRDGWSVARRKKVGSFHGRCCYLVILTCSNIFNSA